MTFQRFGEGGKIQILNKFSHHVIGIVTQDKFHALLHFCINASIAQLVRAPDFDAYSGGIGPAD